MESIPIVGGAYVLTELGDNHSLYYEGRPAYSVRRREENYHFGYLKWGMSYGSYVYVNLGSMTHFSESLLAALSYWSSELTAKYHRWKADKVDSDGDV